MKTYAKIDLYYMGDYICSTNQSRTCKAAIAAYLERIRYHSFYNGLVDRMILKNPKGLKARFDRRPR